jgi:hypothetical protein
MTKRDKSGRFTSNKPRPERWVIVGDTQVPFHYAPAVELAAQIIEEVNPDHLVYNGDMIDFWSISKHQPNRSTILQALSLQEEVDRTIAIQDKLGRGIHSTCKKHNIDGNHEDRLERFLGYGESKVLGSLRMLRMENVFRYEDRGFASYRPYGEGIWITDNLFVYHGQFVSPVPGSSVKKEIDAIGASVIMNHVHRRSDIRFRQGNHEWRGIENGCLCQLASSYSVMTNWAHALTVVEKYDNRHWDAQVIDIVTDNNVVYCMYRGTKFTVSSDYSDGLSLPWRPDMNRNYEVD